MIQDIVLLGIIPGIFWLWLFHNIFNLIEKRPAKKYFDPFFFGILSIIPITLFEGLLFRFILIEPKIFFPLVHQTIKLIIMITLLRIKKRTLSEEFKDGLDGIRYGGMIAIGLLIVENCIALLFQSPTLQRSWFFFTNYLLNDTGQFPFAWLMLKYPVHLLCGGIIGFTFVRAGYSKAANIRKFYDVLMALGIAIVLESLYNMLPVLMDTEIYFIVMVVSLLVWVIIIDRIKKRKEDYDRNKFSFFWFPLLPRKKVSYNRNKFGKRFTGCRDGINVNIIRPSIKNWCGAVNRWKERELLR